MTYNVTRDNGTTVTVNGEALSELTDGDTMVPVGVTHTYQVAAVVDARYETFMKRVEELAKQTDLDVFLQSQKAGAYTSAHRYLSNATGASTEAAQRAARHGALLIALRGGE